MGYVDIFPLGEGYLDSNSNNSTAGYSSIYIGKTSSFLPIEERI
jgi:hypothetical protein